MCLDVNTLPHITVLYIKCVGEYKRVNVNNSSFETQNTENILGVHSNFENCACLNCSCGIAKEN